MRGILPLGLLFFFGAFAVLSAVLKGRAGVTSLLGVSLTVLEGISGIALMVSPSRGAGSLRRPPGGDRYGGVGGLFVHGPLDEGPRS